MSQPDPALFFFSLYYQPGSADGVGSNAYPRRMSRILQAMGFRVTEANRISLSGWRHRRYDVAWLNWIENYCLSRVYFPVWRLARLAAALWLLRRHCRQIVFVHHDLSPHNANPAQRWFVGLARRLVERVADVVVVHSPAMAGPKTRYVPHPLYRFEDRADRPLAFSNAARAVCFGRISRYKNMDRLVAEWPGGQQLLIAGWTDDPGLVGRLRQQAAGKTVRIDAERLSEEQVDKVLREHDVVVLPHGESSNVVSGAFFHAATYGCIVVARASRAIEALAEMFPYVFTYRDASGLEIAMRAARSRISDGLQRSHVREAALARFGDAAVEDRIRKALDGGGESPSGG